MEDEIKELEENRAKIAREITEKIALLNEEKDNLRDEIDFYSEDSKEVEERRGKIKLFEKDLQEFEKLDKIAKIRLGELLKAKIPQQNNKKVIVTKIEVEEYKKLGEIAKSFTDKGISGESPEFVILMGGVAAGKTTVRRQSFSKNYVNLDYWDIFLAVEKVFGEGNEKLMSFACLVGDMVLFESIEKKKNIVIEIIGADESPFKQVMDSMKDIGYKPVVQFVFCKPEQAWERHLKAVETDRDYQSAHYTERPTLSYFYRYFKLGNMPVEQDYVEKK